MKLAKHLRPKPTNLIDVLTRHVLDDSMARRRKQGSKTPIDAIVDNVLKSDKVSKRRFP